MARPTRPSADDLPRKYHFIINPYPDQRLTRCPTCEGKTGQRKLPLFIHVEPGYPIALNYTCRYCPSCDLLIAHKHEIEHLLADLFAQNSPAAIGNDYLIMGTMDKKAWRESMKQPKAAHKMLATHTSLFKNHYGQLRMIQPGWYPEGVEPREMPAPPSTEWVKRKR